MADLYIELMILSIALFTGVTGQDSIKCFFQWCQRPEFYCDKVQEQCEPCQPLCSVKSQHYIHACKTHCFELWNNIYNLTSTVTPAAEVVHSDFVIVWLPVLGNVVLAIAAFVAAYLVKKYCCRKIKDTPYEDRVSFTI